MFRSHALSLILLLTMCTQSFAEPVTNKQVLETIDQYIAAMREGDYATMATLMHPGELEELKQLFVLLAEQASAQGRLDELAPFLGGAESVTDFKKMPADVFFAKMMTTLTRFMPDLGKLLASAKVTVLGQVSEGEDSQLLHIVTRTEMMLDGNTIRSVSVVSMKRADDELYYLLVDEKARGIARTLEQRFAE